MAHSGLPPQFDARVPPPTRLNFNFYIHEFAEANTTQLIHFFKEQVSRALAYLLDFLSCKLRIYRPIALTMSHAMVCDA